MRYVRIRAPSTSTYVPRLQADQAKIQSRLIDLEGIHEIEATLKHTALRGEDDMSVDPSIEHPTSRAVEVKRMLMNTTGVRLCHATLLPI